MANRISNEEALSFLLAHLVVEQARELTLTQVSLFRLVGLAREAADTINATDGIIPHEVIESVARDFEPG